MESIFKITNVRMNVDHETRRGTIRVEEIILRDEDEKRLWQNTCDTQWQKGGI